MIPVKEAREIILDRIPILGTEKVTLFSALGRILAEDIATPHSVPPHTNSAMDGYAVRSVDLHGASQQNPVILKVIEDLPAGYVSQHPVGKQQAIRIMTGAPLPKGADAVVRVEDTARGEGNQVLIFKAIPPHYDVRLAGEDLAQGEIVLSKGTLIRPAEIGLLASMGKASVLVHQRAQVAIVSTGDELVDIDEPLQPGKIINSNSYSLAALVLEAGAIPIQLGIAKDTRADLEEKFSHGARADVIISSGGVSVGDYDLVKEMLNTQGSEMQFWKVCMKPGKPQAFGSIGGKPTFGLPGNPVSSMVSFEIFVRPALLKMMGHTQIYRAIVTATLEEDIKKSDERKHFVRVVLKRQNGKYTASTTGAQGSGILRSMSKANGLAVIDETRMSVQAGEEVPVMVLDHSLGMSAERQF
ncbi:molybdopterin molybdenumtransferase MoeA [candidate division KSB3 bacterium]|uniref:Molybdopterin molybdenumtransferase n=1 Tax=candidate division KSB3 bacterium TaxID=2044937 RepID=A0A9D5JRS4_9BACT|nr:molybdopterin molybdenumtransferase MoeA [candidate division KSB3 bacterium]MBD3323057.1 molybdopterin molybdenumtransferase MoeA [candidate division KSB3 bacterium]